MHYGIKPYKCQFCSKAFNEKGNLKTHLRVHTGERPYKCKECKNGFKTLGQLRDHIISHTVYKPFQCPYCKKFYRRRSILKIHMSLHLKDPSYLSSRQIYEDDFNKSKIISHVNNEWTKAYMILDKNKKSYKTAEDDEADKNKIRKRVIFGKSLGLTKTVKKTKLFSVCRSLIKTNEIIKDEGLNQEDITVQESNKDLDLNNNIHISNEKNNIINNNVNKADIGKNILTRNDVNNDFNYSFYFNRNFNNNYNNQIINNHLNNILRMNLLDDNNYLNNNNDLFLFNKNEKENEIDFLAFINTLVKDKLNESPSKQIK